MPDMKLSEIHPASKLTHLGDRQVKHNVGELDLSQFLISASLIEAAAGRARLRLWRQSMSLSHEYLYAISTSSFGCQVRNVYEDNKSQL